MSMPFARSMRSLEADRRRGIAVAFATAGLIL